MRDFKEGVISPKEALRIVGIEMEKRQQEGKPPDPFHNQCIDLILGIEAEPEFEKFSKEEVVWYDERSGEEDL